MEKKPELKFVSHIDSHLSLSPSWLMVYTTAVINESKVGSGLALLGECLLSGKVSIRVSS